MLNKNRILILIIIGLSMSVWAGCPKRVEPVKETIKVDEERITPSTRKSEETRGKEEGLRGESPSQRDTMREGAKITDAAKAGLEDIYFDYDKSTIRDDLKKAMEKNVKALQTSPNLKIKIEGHCDERGTNEYNLALGEKRAKSIKIYLVARGINENRISTISYGEEKPVCSEHDEGCWAKNRRAHFTIVE